MPSAGARLPRRMFNAVLDGVTNSGKVLELGPVTAPYKTQAELAFQLLTYHTLAFFVVGVT